MTSCSAAVRSCATSRSGGAPGYAVSSAKMLGAAHGRRLAFRPRSIVNLSGMSYGALSPVAVEALNRGAALSGALHNTGEGGLAPSHQHGGELIFQIGTGYYGCRDERGRFCLERLLEQVARAPLRAIEIKLSQGAKAGRARRRSRSPTTWRCRSSSASPACTALSRARASRRT